MAADCSHHHKPKPGGHGPQGCCPMCELLGSALPGAEAPALVTLVQARLIGRLGVVASIGPRAPPRLQAAFPRGPPVMV